MKTGRTLLDLADERERQMSSKRDLVVPPSLLQCRTDEGGELKMLIDARSADAAVDREYGVTDLARRQLADKLKIPFAYFDRNVTHFSQEVADYDRATDFEALDGKLIELPANNWREVVTAG